MAELGKGYINVIPKFPGLASSISQALGGVDANQTGQKWGTGFSKGVSGGFVKSGAAVGAFSALTNTAIGAVTSNLDAAISRFDTLNNYPRVMQSLGYSSDAADSSISKMSDRLLGLPTTLDSMVKTVQGISVITKDLDLATESGLALNDMLLASGSSQQLVTSAQEQFRQMLSKGKPDMQDWKSLTQAMPGQLDQLARSMLGPTANANDLYAALGGGKGNKAKFTMTDLLKEIIKLDKEGGDGFASFEEQARQATGGVQTSMANLGTSISRGIAGVMDAVGQDTISGVFSDLKGGINDTFGVIQDIVSDNAPQIKAFATSLKDVAPSAMAAGAGLMVFKAGESYLPGVINKGKQLKESFQLAAGGAGTLGESLKATGAIANPAGVALGLAGAAAGILAMKAYEAYQNQKNFELATKGLSDAVSDTVSLATYAETIDGVGKKSTFTATSLNDFATAASSHVKNMQKTNEESQASIAQLNTYQEIIEECAGKTDLSSEAQGRLEYAIKGVNDEFGLSITAADVAAGKYTDQNGKVQDLTTSIDALIEAKKKEIKLDAISSNLKGAYETQSKAYDAYATAYDNYQKQVENWKNAGGTEKGDEYNTMLAAKKAMDDASEACATADEGVKKLENSYGDLEKKTTKSKDAFDDWGKSVPEQFSRILTSHGTSMDALTNDLRDLGVNTGDLTELEQDQLQELLYAYNGTMPSIVGVLDQFGVGMDGAAKKSAYNIKNMSDTLEQFKGSANGALDGVDMSTFASKLNEAGVSSEQLANIGSDNFNRLAQQCDYDLNLMTAMVQAYNSVLIFDKDGKITVDEATLIDAQGNLYKWNGSKLEDKNGNAAVNDIRLMDAQGHVVEWNGSKLISLTGSATASGNLKEALADAERWNNLNLLSKSATAVVNFAGSAIGSILGRKNAAGGIRLHADGAIATKATFLEDVVGEDGAEAIVPLTNRKYSQPFVDLIAEGVNDKFKEGGGNTYVTIHLTVGASASEKEITRAIAREIKLHGLMGNKHGR